MSVHAIEPVPDTRPTVTFLGEQFALRSRGVPLLRLMKFATLAKRGLSTDDAEGLAAVYDLLTACIAPDEWARFERTADDLDDDGTKLVQVIKDAVTVLAARPTTPPADSPGGQSTTAPSSAGGSSSRDSSNPVRTGDERVQRDLEARGRPDIAVAVLQARRASTRR